MTRRTLQLVGPLVAILAIALGGCGGNDNNKSAGGTKTVSAVGKDAKVAGEVPAAIRQRGTLTAAADATYPPNEFIKPGSKTVVGMDADLAKALGQVMGLKVNVVNATFDSIIPGLAAKKYDLGMSSFTDTKEREKTLDFVTYLVAGTEFFTKSDGPTINTLDDLCGRKVSAEKGTTQQDQVTAQIKKCKAAGKPAPTLFTFPDQNGVNLALSSGRVEVDLADSPVADYVVKQSSGQFKLRGKAFGTAPYGIAIPRGTGMVTPVHEALKILIAKGTYHSILTKWAIKHFAIKNPKVNGAVN